MRPHSRCHWAILFGAGLAFLLPTTAAEPADELPVTGKAEADLVSFDHMMTKFVKAHSIPGATLAVAKDGRVVYERGFGYANRDAKEPVKPESLFRIASLSKPITAVAVLQLVERGKLKLDDRVFDVLGLAAHVERDTKLDERWKKVTILHLLHHTGGWDRDNTFDPMFRSPEIVEELKTKPPAGPNDIIRYMLRRPLQFDPGEKSVYSNFGYCLLGRVIERVSRQFYETYVRKEVLAPLGITHMHLGHTLLKDRAPGEVHYYAKGTGTAILGPNLGNQVPLPYGTWNLEATDSHGGWIASAGDLVRFAAAFNDPEKCKVLNARSIAIMFAPPAGKVGHKPNGKPRDDYYACGWYMVRVGDNQINSFHTGSLEGTSTLLVRRCDNLTWAVLFNTRDGTGKKEPADAVDGLVHEAADKVKKWPAR
jgi:N-acyl-D-amino-acid deacylase